MLPVLGVLLFDIAPALPA